MMRTINQGLRRRYPMPLGLEVRYERSFLLDLKTLEPVAFDHAKKFVFEDFHQLTQLQNLPDFRQIGTSGIFYRFTLGRYLIGLEITGQIIKFLRILPIEFQ